MSELDSVARVVINVRDGAISRQGFGVPLILAYHNHTPGRVKAYSRWEEMLDDGFVSSDAAVRQARALKSSGPTTVPRFLVGRLSTPPPAKVVMLTPSPDVKALFSATLNGDVFSTVIYKYTPVAANAVDYVLTINGIPYTYTSDASATAAEIVAGLSALVNADSACPVVGSGSTVLVLTARNGLTPADIAIVASTNLGGAGAPTGAEIVSTLLALINASSVPITASGSGTLILTADVAGEPFALEHSANFAATETTTWDSTAKDALTADLVAIRSADTSWYLALSDGSSLDEILTLAAAVEGMDSTILFVSTGDAGVLSSGSTTDVGKRAKALNYKRTAGMHTDHPGTYPMATLAGIALPRAPGSITLSYKSLPGQVARSYSEEERAQLELRNMIRYVTIAGQDVTRNAKMFGGQWIDITIGIDFVKARIQEEVFLKFKTTGKVPMTQKGAEGVGDAVRLALKAAQTNQIIAEGTWTVNVPKVSAISPTDRQDRHLTPVTWFATFVGAIESVDIEGDVMF